MAYICYSVKSSYPEESGYVDKRKAELDQMWKDLMVRRCHGLSYGTSLSWVVIWYAVVMGCHRNHAATPCKDII